jgi:hypothetical protein
MNINRQQLHDLVDALAVEELGVVYHVLTKFIPEDVPMADEIAAIAAGREAVQRGEIFSDSEIDWGTPPVIISGAVNH